MTDDPAHSLHSCNWPRNGVLAIDIHSSHYTEQMMGQMEYPNRTADPEEQICKTTRL